MLPELGLFATILALGMAGLNIILPLYGLIKKQDAYLQIARPLSLCITFFLSLSTLFLLYAFAHNDFSLSYVAQHSNSSLPLIYKLTAFWAGHEGSLLLWILILGFWMSAASLFSRSLPATFLARLLIIMACIMSGLLLFLLLTSNPFARTLPNFPLDGSDLNPLLQDPGLIIHPPLLYLGYVGFSVPFAFAIATLWIGHLEKSWVDWIKPFLLIAWSFLTLGIMLGSWWAYYELGWGGWWFWDPVENVSLIPWLSATALVHTLIVTKKQKLFTQFSLLLAILTFGFCLFGTFLVRSGLITSVHAFANDPKRGLFIIQFIAILIGFSLLLYVARVQRLSNPQRVFLYSRESLLVFNAMLLFIAALTILLGTLYPLIYEHFTQKSLSVGFPYFNATFIPILIPVLCSIPLGPFMKWGENYPFAVLNTLKWSLLLSVLAGCLLPWLIMKVTFFGVIVGLSLSFWIIFGTIQRVIVKTRGVGIRGFSLGGWAMVLGHLGMAVTVIGIVIVSNYSIENEVRVMLNQPITIADYQVTMLNLKDIEGSNYIGKQAQFLIKKDDKFVAELYPEKRLFVTPGITTTETAIDPGLFRDIYIAIGENLPEGGIGAKIYYKPFVRWIWFGAFMIAIAALLAAVNSLLSNSKHLNTNFKSSKS